MNSSFRFIPLALGLVLSALCFAEDAPAFKEFEGYWKLTVVGEKEIEREVVSYISVDGTITQALPRLRVPNQVRGHLRRDKETNWVWFEPEEKPVGFLPKSNDVCISGSKLVFKIHRDVSGQLLKEPTVNEYLKITDPKKIQEVQKQQAQDEQFFNNDLCGMWKAVKTRNFTRMGDQKPACVPCINFTVHKDGTATITVLVNGIETKYRGATFCNECEREMCIQSPTNTDNPAKPLTLPNMLFHITRDGRDRVLVPFQRGKVYPGQVGVYTREKQAEQDKKPMEPENPPKTNDSKTERKGKLY